MESYLFITSVLFESNALIIICTQTGTLSLVIICSCCWSGVRQLGATFSFLFFRQVLHFCALTLPGHFQLTESNAYKVLFEVFIICVGFLSCNLLEWEYFIRSCQAFLITISVLNHWINWLENGKRIWMLNVYLFPIFH